MKLFVTCSFHLEPLLISELQELGIPAQAGFRGVFVERTIENVYRINYLSRIATRVLWPLVSFPCTDRDSLYAAASTIPWTKQLKPDQTFAIDANVSDNPHLKNSLFAGLVVKDALCDQIRKECGLRPSVDIKNPDVQINLFIHQNRGIISIDTSGDPLYKRSWRTDTGKAPLQESLAAALLRMANYQAGDILCDPCCGSGTFLVEAAMIQTKMPPGFKRSRWGFFHMPEHSPDLWQEIKVAADSQIVPFRAGSIFGADQDRVAVGRAQKHCSALSFPIPVATSEVSRYKPPGKPTLVITNPPYGHRVSASPQISSDILRFARDYGARSLLLVPEEEGRFHKEAEKKPLSNGGLPVCAVSYQPSHPK